MAPNAPASFVAIPNGGGNDRFFGQLLNTRAARVIQLGARLNW